MAVERVETTNRSPYLDGEVFGAVGAYERIDAVAHYAVDPTLEVNSTIVDLDRAARDDDGLVRFEGDVTILRPVDSAKGCRTALVEVPNRGRRTASSLYNRAPMVVEPTSEIDPGDGFLFRHGWTVVWCGWQWDVPRSPARMGLAAPIVLDQDGDPEVAWTQLRLQLHTAIPSVDLTDHHVGLLGGHTPLPSADVDDPEAKLLRRPQLWSEPEELPRSSWRFAADDKGSPKPNPENVWLDGGFEPGVIYDLIYRTTPCRIAGAGMVAVRDLGTWLRSEAAAPVSGDLDHLIVTGQSQCGRFLRTSLHAGLNLGEDGHAAYDGVLAHIAGGRRGEFNHRTAQPSVQPTPSFGHLFPFADEPQTDPRTGDEAGLLDRQRSWGAMPKVIYTNTSAEYWRGDASLAHTSVVDGSDIEPPSETRHYLLASTQHGAGTLPFLNASVFGSKGGNHFNVVDHTPLMRAALTNLRGWVAEGVEPPPNAVPRSDDGTGTSRDAVLDQLSTVGAIARPTTEGLTTMRPIDLGAEVATGVGEFPAQPCGDPYPTLVSAVDADGNEVAGIRMPDVEVPVATHTGWNPRHYSTGGVGQLLEYQGSTIPFPAEPGTDDPRPSLAERYATRDDYLAQVRDAALALVEQRHLLAQDVEACIDIAAARYDAVIQYPTPQ